MKQRIVLTILAVIGAFWLALMNKPETSKRYVTQTFASSSNERDTVFIRDTVFVEKVKVVSKVPEDYAETMSQNKALREKIWSFEVEIDAERKKSESMGQEIAQMDGLIVNLNRELTRMEGVGEKLGREVDKWRGIVEAKDHTIETLQDLNERLQDEDVEDLSSLVPQLSPKWPVFKNSISGMVMYDGNDVYFGPSYSRNFASFLSVTGGFYTEESLKRFYPFGGVRINF